MQWPVLRCIPMLLQDSKQRAAAAAAAVAAAQGQTEPKTVTETRRFAGKDIQVWLPTPIVAARTPCNCDKQYFSLYVIRV